MEVIEEQFERIADENGTITEDQLMTHLLERGVDVED